MADGDPTSVPDWVTWVQRPFPDANLLLLSGRHPALIDSGFVGHAPETAAWVRERTTDLELVVNTHWHSDHVGGNALLQAGGAGIAASAADADDLAASDPGCCVAEYLDQPVAPYTVDVSLDDGAVLDLGEAQWQVVATPGHTAGHLALWQPAERLLVVGDALSGYDVGWVNTALDGQAATQAALTSLQRLADLSPRVLLTAHGPLPTDTAATLDKALQRAQRLVDDPDGAVWYGARRVLAFALMIHDGVPTEQVEEYLLARAWLQDAATLLRRHPADLAEELVRTMLASGALVTGDGRLRAAAPHTRVPQERLQLPYPRDWPRPTH